ncbi:corazonin isoform X2 [Rhodnius prolixus]|uniref:corazonin isoform X2 n=1 Tax=Rhodnius prolixus TaxID=13249 RepID=UPI003D18BC41
MNFRSSCLLIFIIYSIVHVFGQTFQYSRGWTNGKRAGIPSKEVTACQLQRIKSLLEGKTIPQLYWPCEWSPFMEAALSRQMKTSELTSLPVVAPLTPEIEEK